MSAPTKRRSFTARTQLGDGGVGALHRQHREAGEAIGMAGDGRRQMVVHLAGHADTIGTRHEVGTGTGVGEHLHRDSGLVHGLQALLADLGQRSSGLGLTGSGLRPGSPDG